MVVIDGLDSAIVGTALHANGLEVIAYDGYAVEELLAAGPYAGMSINDFLDEIGITPLGVMAPMFVFLDRTVREEISDRGSRIVN